MITGVVDIEQFREGKKPVVSRREASLTGGRLLVVLTDCEPNDLRATLQFDLTPDDLAVIETFIGNLAKRTEDRINGYGKRTFSQSTQPA